jgi:PAS domain-containing protein
LCEMTGFPADELLARHFRDIVHPDDLDRGMALLQQLRASDLPEASIENRLSCKDGSQPWVKMTASRLRTAGDAESLAVVQQIAPPAAREGERGRLTYWGIEVDTDRPEVSWNGRRVPVTLKEVLLLRYLIRHRGEMLARDRLLRDVWGYEHAGRSRTLDVHVCRLRRKLPPLADSLATIGHFGYTLSQAVGGGAADGS